GVAWIPERQIGFAGNLRCWLPARRGIKFDRSGRCRARGATTRRATAETRMSLQSELSAESEGAQVGRRSMLRNTAPSWGSLARAFHWLLAITILSMIAYGYWMNHYAPRFDRYFYRSIHADIGYVVLLLTALRLIWRAVNPAPVLPAGTPMWQRVAAHVSHGALYLF